MRDMRNEKGCLIYCRPPLRPKSIRLGVGERFEGGWSLSIPTAGTPTHRAPASTDRHSGSLIPPGPIPLTGGKEHPHVRNLPDHRLGFCDRNFAPGRRTADTQFRIRPPGDFAHALSRHRKTRHFPAEALLPAIGVWTRIMSCSAASTGICHQQRRAARFSLCHHGPRNHAANRT
jgi:hypothetical protein